MAWWESRVGLTERRGVSFRRMSRARTETDTGGPTGTTRSERIDRGDVFWVGPDDSRGPLSGHPHPHVVIQDDVFNHSRVATVVVCALTSNLRRASWPGNILLEAGEGASLSGASWSSRRSPLSRRSAWGRRSDRSRRRGCRRSWTACDSSSVRSSGGSGRPFLGDAHTLFDLCA